MTDFEAQPTFAARSISVWNDEVHIHFAGESEQRLSIIDVYDVDDLTYRRSYTLPRRVNKAFVVGTTVYAEFSDPYPTLMKYVLADR